MSHLLSCHTVKTDVDLVSENLLKTAALSLLECLTHAEVDVHSVGKGEQDLLVDELVGLSVVLASLAVSEDDGVHTDVLEHGA